MVHCNAVNWRSARCQSRLNRLRQTLAGDETLHTSGLDPLVLLLGELGQPIGGSPKILTEHRTPGDDLVFDRLLNQLVLADAQPRGNLSGQRTEPLVTPTQWEDCSRSHASSMIRFVVMSRRPYDITLFVGPWQ